MIIAHLPATALRRPTRRLLHMKNYPRFISAVVLVAIASLSCAQSADKGANSSAAAGPELRWKYETGG